jgi:hypothetical protein
MMVDDVRYTLERGNALPYDAPNEWWVDSSDPAPPPADDWAHAAARGVMADLTDRHTIKRAFEGIDEDTRSEIVQMMAGIIRLAQETYGNSANEEEE